MPVAGPPAIGVKMIATLHVPDGTTELDVEQVVPDAATAKGPETAIGTVKVRFLLPVLVTVTVCGGLAIPIGSDWKVGAAEKLIDDHAWLCECVLAYIVRLITSLALPRIMAAWVLARSPTNLQFHAQRMGFSGCG